MWLPIEDLPAAVYGVRAEGEITRAEQNAVIAPLLEEARRVDRRVRLLLHFGPRFTKFSSSEAWDDLAFGLKHVGVIHCCAVVTDQERLRGAAWLLLPSLPYPFRVFPGQRYDAAVAWVATAPKSSVVVLGARDPRRTRDAATVVPARAADRAAV